MTVNFLFLLSPNNSGSTIISQYLAAQTGGYLPPFGNNEGQMAPGVRALMRDRPWNRRQHWDWGPIRAEWTRLAEAAGKTLFIEASPPNIVRTEAIRRAFGGEARFLLSVSGPYSFIASMVFNYLHPPLDPAALRKAARQWIVRVERIRQDQLAHPDTPRMSYEAFCADPTLANRLLYIPVRDATPPLPGKRNAPVGQILDLTKRGLAFLTAEEWDIANEVLGGRPDLTEFFGYDLAPGAELVGMARSDAALLEAGLGRRAKFEARRPGGS